MVTEKSMGKGPRAALHTFRMALGYMGHVYNLGAKNPG